MLRFDFTGLGSSEGDFANSTFSSNVADLVRAADHLRERRKAPSILIGHSLGGAAILAAAGQIPEAKAVVDHRGALRSRPCRLVSSGSMIEDIRAQGEVEVSLAGRPFRIKREFLDDIAEHELMKEVTGLHKALLVMHSPTDDTVGIDNATKIFVCGQAPQELRLARPAPITCSPKRGRRRSMSADVIAAWASRYVEPAAATGDGSSGSAPRQGRGAGDPQRASSSQIVTVGPHRLVADEPVAAGGEDGGPGPYDFLLAGLGACTSMTMRLYADRKSLPLDRVTVTLQHSQDLRQGLRGMRDARGHARPDRSRHQRSRATSMPSSASG